jgi:mRNA-degrading endonuclease toxin of MazEF toxin-antitoxin module
LDPFDIVVVVLFPQSDRLAEKRRPALVISNRKLAPFGLIWVAMITSADNAPRSCDVAVADLARAGLPAPSVGGPRRSPASNLRESTAAPDDSTRRRQRPWRRS